MKNRLFNLVIVAFIFPIYLHAQENYYGGENGKKLDWTIHYLQDYYVDSLNVDSLAEIAIINMLASLDPFSVYQSAETLAKQKENDSGYSGMGIGLDYFLLKDQAIVTWILKDSPADSAQIVRGDLLLSVNEVDVHKASKEEIKALFQSEEEDIVKIEISRKGQKMMKEIKIDRLPLYSILSSYMITGEVGYIKQYNYTQKSVKEMEDAIADLKELGMKKLVLDLRGNYGGVVTSAVEIADIFLSKGKLVCYTDGYNQDREDFETKEKGLFEKGEMIVLVDAYTKSAAELFTVALQDWDRALIMGVPTFGKGLVQQSYQLNDSSAVRLTIAKYFSPTGRTLQKYIDYDATWLNTQQEKLSKNYITSDLLAPSEVQVKTHSGRTVLGGEGGVIPDIYMAHLDEEKHLSEHPDLYTFSTTYLAQNRDALKLRYPAVEEYTKDEKLEQDLSVGLFSFLGSGYELPNIESSTMSTSIGDLAMVRMKSWIAAQLWDDASYYQVINTNDKVIKEAVTLFDNGTMLRLKIQN